MARLADRFASAIRPATPEDLAAMARIHHGSGTPGLLTDLGEAFLRDVYYRGLLDSEFGMADVLAVGDDILGFVTYSTDSGRLFRDIFMPRFANVLIHVGRSAMSRPRIIGDVFDTALSVLRPSLVIPPAEIVSLEVARTSQGLGLGLVLAERAVLGLSRIDAGPIVVRILADPPTVRRIYDDLGFRQISSFRLHGRRWLAMQLG